MCDSHGLLAVDLDGDVLESCLELLFLAVSGNLAIDTELEVEAVDCAVSIIFKGLAVNEDMDILLWAVVDDLEGDPFALHAADKDVAASVVSEGAILEVEHSRGGRISLRAFMLDLEE